MTRLLQNDLFVSFVGAFAIMPLFAWLLVRYKQETVHRYKSRATRVLLGAVAGTVAIMASSVVTGHGTNLRHSLAILSAFTYFSLVLMAWLWIIEHELPLHGNNGGH